MTFDMTSLLSAVMESNIASSMYKHMESTLYTPRVVEDSTRRAFDSKMRSDASVYRQASQNMADAMSMVEIAQSGTTAIKVNLNDMYKLANEAATLTGMTDEQYAAYSRSLSELASVITNQAGNTTFNGMSLLDGSAGMNADGVVVLQGGSSQINQDLTNLLDSSLTEVIGANGNMNLNLLEGETTITDQASAQALADKLQSYINRVQGIEADYSYDIKGLENLSILYEDKANIFENTIQYKNAEEQANSSNNAVSSNYIDELLMSSTGNGSIFNTSS